MWGLGTSALARSHWNKTIPEPVWYLAEPCTSRFSTMSQDPQDSSNDNNNPLPSFSYRPLRVARRKSWKLAGQIYLSWKESYENKGHVACKQVLGFSELTEAELEVPWAGFNCVELHFHRRYLSAALGRGRLSQSLTPLQSDHQCICFLLWGGGGVSLWDFILKRPCAKNKLTNFQTTNK